MGNALYNRIGVLRAERKLSRQDLADALGINYQTVGFLERGDYSPSLVLAMDLSDYFKLPIEAIFSREPFRPLSEVVYGEAGGSAARPASRSPQSSTESSPQSPAEASPRSSAGDSVQELVSEKETA